LPHIWISIAAFCPDRQRVKQMSQHGEKRPDIDKAILQKEHGANFIADQIKTPQRAGDNKTS